MKKAFLFPMVLIIAFAALVLSGCKEEEEEKEDKSTPLQFASFLTDYTRERNGYGKNIGDYSYYLYFRSNGFIELRKGDRVYVGNPSVTIAQYDKIDYINSVKELNKTTYFFTKDRMSEFVDCVGEEIEFVYLGGVQIRWKD
jgi:hypothetical protein